MLSWFLIIIHHFGTGELLTKSTSNMYNNTFFSCMSADTQCSSCPDGHSAATVGQMSPFCPLSCSKPLVLCKAWVLFVTMSCSKSTSVISAVPYRSRFKDPQSCCFVREWLYGFELSLETPRLHISTPLEIVTLCWQVTQRKPALIPLESVNEPDYLMITVNPQKQVWAISLLARCGPIIRSLAPGSVHLGG